MLMHDRLHAVASRIDQHSSTLTVIQYDRQRFTLVFRYYNRKFFKAAVTTISISGIVLTTEYCRCGKTKIPKFSRVRIAEF